MSSKDWEQENFISKNRLEALVDGVFAFAMTLLVLSLAIPTIPVSRAAAELPGYIAGMYPQFIRFLLAFVLLAVFWIIHQRHFHILHNIDSTVIWLNIAILVSIVFLPFTTSVSGDYSNVQVAVVLFDLNMFVIALFFTAQWYYITSTPRLVGTAISKRTTRCGLIRSLVTPVVALIAVALTFFFPENSMFAYLLIPLGIYLVRRF